MNIDHKTFYDAVRKDIFHGRLTQIQVEVMEEILSMTEDLSDNVRSYIFATAWHESRMEPVREGFKDTDAQARAYVRRQGYAYAKQVNGHVYYGRGIVQLTHWTNYKAWGIENTPDKALEVAFAVKLLVVGMLDGRYNGKGKGIQFYLDKAKPDWKNARRTVNITDRWELIKGYAGEFKEALLEAEQAYTKPTTERPKPVVVPKDVADGKTDMTSTTIWTSFGGMITTIATAVFGMGKDQPLLVVGICVLAVGVFIYIRKERKDKARKFGI